MTQQMHASISVRIAVSRIGSPMRASTTYAPTCASVCVRARGYGFGRNVRTLPVGVERVRFGSQAFSYASAFNANIASWNVLRVTTYTAAFDNVGLADCIKRGVFDTWGSMLQKAYPTWSSLSVCTATPSPRYAYPCVGARMCPCARERLCVCAARC